MDLKVSYCEGVQHYGIFLCGLRVVVVVIRFGGNVVLVGSTVGRPVVVVGDCCGSLSN